MAIVKQLGVPNVFITSADLKWNKLASIINKLHKLDLLEENIDNLSYRDRCHLVYSNPVLIASHFQ